MWKIRYELLRFLFVQGLQYTPPDQPSDLIWSQKVEITTFKRLKVCFHPANSTNEDHPSSQFRPVFFNLDRCGRRKIKNLECFHRVRAKMHMFFVGKLHPFLDSKQNMHPFPDKIAPKTIPLRVAHTRIVN